MKMPEHGASEGIAIQHGTGANADYECPCPICGEEAGVDDLDAEYECQVCHNLVIFREENIKMAESEDCETDDLCVRIINAFDKAGIKYTIAPEGGFCYADNESRNKAQIIIQNETGARI